jgi:hypothetical protein
MTTVQFMSNAKHNYAYSVDEEVANRLYNQARESQSRGKDKTASAYVNRLLKWALDNYIEPTPIKVPDGEQG